ncbi:MAG: translation initiation factor IF-2 [Acidobacteria bacterium]|nr:translation initiation factor IF-2 [Acidobacteriota bacterium]
MAAKKPRVHELAKEFGLTTKELLDLAARKGIDAKTSSSSIDEAQADRLRRAVDDEGLRRDVQPEEPAKKKKAVAKKAAPKPDVETTPTSDYVTDTTSSTEAPSDVPKVVRARTSTVKPAPPKPTTPAAPQAPTSVTPTKRVAPPTSATGRPIPPPPSPRPPVSSSGRVIPPPPGGPRSVRPTTGGPGGGRPSGPRPGGASRPGAAVGGRPLGGRPGGGGGGPGGFSGGGGARPGAPAGGPGRGRPGGGPGGGPRGSQRKTKARRGNKVEEFEPTKAATWVPSNAPVPEGEIIVERGSTAKDLGPKLNRSAADIIRFLFLQGEMVTAVQGLTDDMIELYAAEIGAEVRLVDAGEEQEAQLLAKFFDEDEDDEKYASQTRPPVVTVMGHVDHGKTLTLDRIRSSNVVDGEAGGITQHIGAYQVEWKGQSIAFIDTPGHEAFTAMRARGAKVTDIVVLVVAADDGVMPQTIEAINHAKAAEVPIIVAVNKIDKADANPDRVLQQVSEHGLVPEKWGGETIVVEISALQRLGIDDLLEQILLVAELEELTSRHEGRAAGTVLEANLEVGRGPVATVMVQKGQLKLGDHIVAGAAWGKVKALVDDKGRQVKVAGPSTPVQVLGFSEPPNAGDEVRVASDSAQARTLAEARAQRIRTTGHIPIAGTGARLEDLFEAIQRGETATLNVVLKADVQGSLEACTESLRKLERDDVKLAIVHRGVGGITENDVQLAKAANATIIGFNVRPDRRSRDMAEREAVEIRTYEIIYKLIEEIQAAMLGLLAPEFEEVVTGEAEVREVFRIPKIGAIAGCYVREGTITRGTKVRFLREGTIIWKGSITSLRRFKDDVREVQSGFECGIGLSDYQDLKDGDIIETYEEREIPRTA